MEVENQNLNQVEETRKEESYEVPTVNPVAAVGENADPTTTFDYYDMSAQDLSVFGKLGQLAENITTYGVGAYVIYNFYKEVVKPYLYPESKPKTMIERIEEVKESLLTKMDVVKSDVDKLETEVEQLKSDVSDIDFKIYYINEDLTNRCNLMQSQQARIIKEESREVSLPAIPAWQL